MGQSRWQGSPGAAGGGLVSGQWPKPWAPGVAAPHLQEPFCVRSRGPSLSWPCPHLLPPLPWASLCSPHSRSAQLLSRGLSLVHTE